MLEEAPPLLQEQFIEQFGRLEDWEKTQILSSLQRMVAMMEARGLDATPMLATGPMAASREDTEAFLVPGDPEAAGTREDLAEAGGERRGARATPEKTEASRPGPSGQKD